MRYLRDDQAAAFDVEYVGDARWERVRARLDAQFPSGGFRFLDVGGGNGRFADRLLTHYPHAEGALVDCSDLLLSRNVPRRRKQLVRGSAAEIAQLFDGQRFDVVFFNWLLHHLVADSYRETRVNMVRSLAGARRLLAPGGCISIFEDLYDGLYVDWLPSRLVFHLTSSRLLAGATRRLGANTAGVGVCFLSHRRWLHVLGDAGLRVVAFADEPLRRVTRFRRMLHVGDDRVGHYWCRACES